MTRRMIRSLEELQADAADHLTAYTDVAGKFAFKTYDQTEIHSGDLTPGDVLMANLLSLRLDWRDVVPLFAQDDGPYTKLRTALNAALDEARDLPPLVDCTEEQAVMPLLKIANEAAEACPPTESRRARTWTMVTVSKVLHRLDTTVPLVDSVVLRFYGAKWGTDLRQRLRADLIASRPWLSALAEKHLVRGEPMALTRVADIVIWMDGRSKT